MTPSTLLQLIWLASPALPVGGYSYSEGLEAVIEAGLVGDEATTQRWLLDQQALALGRSELPLLAQALAAWRQTDAPRLAALNDWHRRTRESRELLRQTEQMGRSMLEWLRAGSGDGDARVDMLAALAPAPTWPLAWALAVVRSGATARDALLAHGFGWAENLVQAALKAVPLGQTAGQRVLGALAEALPPLVDDALAMDDTARQAYTPGLALLSARHETQYSRLFRS
ncbi:MAG: urease accessory protein UreF [Rubrivivax sp.]|nr:urease accessory protein UreF [Rubrivivax sp.]